MKQKEKMRIKIEKNAFQARMKRFSKKFGTCWIWFSRYFKQKQKAFKRICVLKQLYSVWRTKWKTFHRTSITGPFFLYSGLKHCLKSLNRRHQTSINVAIIKECCLASLVVLIKNKPVCCIRIYLAFYNVVWQLLILILILTICKLHT